MRQRLHSIVDAALRDTAKARELQPDGSYRRRHGDGEPVCAQELLMQQAIRDAALAAQTAEPKRRTLLQRLRKHAWNRKK